MAARHATGVGRRTTGRLVAAALARLTAPSAPARHLVIVPPDLRSTDPSFWPEVQSGHFGLSGQVASLTGKGGVSLSPFAVEPPTEDWAAALHAFGWLRHMEAAETIAAEEAARKFIADWIRTGRRNKVALRPEVRARRILSWIAHAPFVLDRAPDDFYNAFGSALAHEVKALSSARLRDADLVQRLICATALVVARLTIEGSEDQLPKALDRLDAEIERQVFPDGGHVSRNPEIIFQLLLDWLPLKSCLDGRGREASTPFIGAIHHMLAQLRSLRMGDGSIARFNGMGIGDPVAVATLLAYDDEPPPLCHLSKQSRYARLECADAILIADAGPAPPAAASGSAHAGCLSFELSHKGLLVICNSGRPCSSGRRWVPVARSTASHSTLSVAESSSSELIRSAKADASGDGPLRGPDRVRATAEMVEDEAVMTASHDGYVGRYNLEHHRELRLAADGEALTGRDRLQTPGAQDRLKRDLPFAIHFHLHPDSTCRPARGEEGASDALIVTLRDGQNWLFEAKGYRAGIEESLFFAAHSGPHPRLQIVVRGMTGGVTEVAWSLKHLNNRPAGALEI